MELELREDIANLEFKSEELQRRYSEMKSLSDLELENLIKRRREYQKRP
jgi:hypothetical protein